MADPFTDISVDNSYYELNRMCERQEMEDYFGVPLDVDFSSVPGKIVITKAEEQDG